MVYDEAELAFWEKAAIEDPYSRICDGWSENEFKNVHATLVDSLDLHSSDVFLDLACGIGRIAKWVTPKVRLYIGMDFSQNMINKAVEYTNHDPKCIFIRNDGETIPLPDSSIDKAVCEIAFQHMQPPIVESYMEEVYRVLKTGGQFICEIPKKSYYKISGYEDVVGLLKEFDCKLLEKGLPNEPYFIPLCTKRWGK